jgi:predicted DNA-binding transcriptional regulator AlpA
LSSITLQNVELSPLWYLQETLINFSIILDRELSCNNYLKDKYMNKEEVKFLRIKGVIEVYSISRSTVYNLVNSQRLKAIKISEGITVYSVKELNELFSGRVI